MIYTGITPAWLASIEAEAQQQLGITINGNEGSATKSGITISWVYDPVELTLTVGDTDKPWFIPEGKIDEELTTLVNSSKPGA